MKFFMKLVGYYAAALIISLFTCYGMSMATYDLLEMVDMLKVGYTIPFELGLAAAETCFCMLVVNAIRKQILPIDDGMDDETEDVFDIEGL